MNGNGRALVPTKQREAVRHLRGQPWSLFLVQLALLGICLAANPGCDKPEESREQLFFRAKPHLDVCQRLVDANGGKKPSGEQWKQSAVELLHLKPKIVASERGKVVLFEILNHPLDSYEAFVYVPEGSEVGRWLKEKAWLERTAEIKKVGEHWYWILY